MASALQSYHSLAFSDKYGQDSVTNSKQVFQKTMLPGRGRQKLYTAINDAVNWLKLTTVKALVK